MAAGGAIGGASMGAQKVAQPWKTPGRSRYRSGQNRCLAIPAAKKIHERQWAKLSLAQRQAHQVDESKKQHENEFHSPTFGYPANLPNLDQADLGRPK